MKRNISYIIVCLVLVVFAGACKKKNVAPKGKNELLSIEWKVASVEFDGVADGTDYSAYRWTFTTGKTYTLTNGTQSLKSGSWEINETSQTLVLDAGTASEASGLIVSLTETAARLEFDEATFKDPSVKKAWNLVK